MAGTNGNGSNGNGGAQIGTTRVKQGLAQMLKGGVIVSGMRLVLVLWKGLEGNNELVGFRKRWNEGLFGSMDKYLGQASR